MPDGKNARWKKCPKDKSPPPSLFFCANCTPQHVVKSKGVQGAKADEWKTLILLRRAYRYIPSQKRDSEGTSYTSWWDKNLKKVNDSEGAAHIDFTC